MTNARPVDDDFLGSFSSASELERQFPAAHRSGMTATVTDGTTEHPYTCDGSTWKPVALYATDTSGNVTGLVGPGGVEIPVQYVGDTVIDGYPLVFAPAAVGGSSNCLASAVTADGLKGMSAYANAAVTACSLDFTLSASRKISSGHLGFLLNVEDFGGEATLGLTFYCADATFANFYSRNITCANPGWYWVSIATPTAINTWKWGVGGGSPVFGTTDFAKIRVRADFTNGNRPKFGVYGVFENPRSTKPQVVISFDDGYSSVYDYGVPSLEKFGLKACCAIIADAIGSNDTNYMMLAELKELVGRGHEMVVHGPTGGTGSLNNYVASPTRYQDVLADVRFHRDYLVSNGLAKNGSEKVYVFPQGFNVFGGNGSTNTEIASALTEAGFLMGRGVSTIVDEVVPHSIGAQKKIMYLPIAGHAWFSEVAEPANIANIIQRISDAGATGKHIVLMFHKIVTGTPTDSLQIKQSNLELICGAVADEVAAGRMQAGTFTTLYKALTRRPYVF